MEALKREIWGMQQAQASTEDALRREKLRTEELERSNAVLRKEAEEKSKELLAAQAARNAQAKAAATAETRAAAAEAALAERSGDWRAAKGSLEDMLHRRGEELQQMEAMLNQRAAEMDAKQAQLERRVADMTQQESQLKTQLTTTSGTMDLMQVGRSQRSHPVPVHSTGGAPPASMHAALTCPGTLPTPCPR